ncbi:MaoC family dehydratase [Branchiibius sp. NY16-3462-2]|uniref:MaoC family dehydratase n=1 Tax=Branchiibius sp. NY16-3462-2 TaxID=1807500 RepID=UPI0007956A5F|nr:MaoC family dehydratase [Branchiibius sp. NY16-3462-2]KYH46148.1 dehydratase [Branchiibius sp. NY16-3462-2]
MRIFTGVDELTAAVGEHLGYSEWHEITQQQIDTFAHATGDHQWIHVDPQKAAAGPFGTTIAHGYLTLSLLPMLSWEVYKIEGVSMGINYGSNKVRFPSVVPVGSRVRAGVELAEVIPGPKGVQVVSRVTVEIDGSDRPACVAETVSLIVP